MSAGDLSVTKGSDIVSVNSDLEALRHVVLGRNLRMDGDLYEIQEHGMEVQSIQLNALTQIKQGQYSVTLNGVDTACVDWNADASSVQDAIESAVGDTVHVERVESTPRGEPLTSWSTRAEVTVYSVYFTGSSFVSDLLELQVDLSACDDLLDYSDVSVTDAEIVVTTQSDGVVDGDMTLTTNYTGVSKTSISAYVVAPTYRVVDSSRAILKITVKATSQGETLTGEFVLTGSGGSTSCLSYDSMPWTVESELKTALGDDDIVVTRSKLDRGGYDFTVYGRFGTSVSFGTSSLSGNAEVFNGCSSNPLEASTGTVDLEISTVQTGFDSSTFVTLGNNALTLASVDDSSSIATWNSFSQNTLKVFAVSGSRFEIDFVTSLGDQSAMEVDQNTVTCNIRVVDNFVAGFVPSSYKIPGLTSGFLYYTRVTTTNSLGYSSSSETSSATIDSVPAFTSEGLSLSYAKHVNEIQRITIAVSSYDEEQTITTSADYIGEKQIIQTSIEEGSVAEGTFTVTYDGLTTSAMSYDISAEDLELEIEALDASIDVSVVRSLSDSRGGFVWTVYFDTPYGNLGQMTCSEDADLLSVGTCHTRTFVDGNELSGTFILSFEGKNTNPIAFNADAATVQSELRSLSTISDSLVVSRTVEPDFAMGYTWTVTFSGNPGDVNMLGFSSSLAGTGHSIEVQESVKGNMIGGTFTLGGPNDEITNPISFDTTEENLESELGAFCGVVSVTKQDLGVDLKEYVVTFLDETVTPGDVAELTVPSHSITGEGAIVHVEEMVKGKEASGTSLLVEFDVPGLRDDNVIRSGENDGGDALTMFEITYDTSSSFSSSNMNIVQVHDLYDTYRVVTTGFGGTDFTLT